MNPQPAPPATVNRFEYNLLRILRFLLGHMPAEQAMNLIYTRLSPPPCLSRACVAVLEETLAKASVLFLVQAGGWRTEKFLRGLKPQDGRVWERHPLEERELAFGSVVPDFLFWLTADKPNEAHETWDIQPDETLSAADELFFAMAFDALRVEPNVAAAMAKLRVIRTNALCWLMNPAELAIAAVDSPVPSFEPWMTGVRAIVLECLQPLLAKRWIRTERSKCLIQDWPLMQRLGAIESAALGGFLAMAKRACRTDLARFVVRTASAVLAANDLTPSTWTGGLRNNAPTRLAERLEIQRSALAIPRSVETLARWDHQARSVGYFDDEYAASQLWKSDWQSANGEEIANKARQVLEQLEPLRT